MQPSLVNATIKRASESKSDISAEASHQETQQEDTIEPVAADSTTNLIDAVVAEPLAYNSSEFLSNISEEF